MSISLNQLIDQVREELLQPRKSTTRDAVYPFLFIEDVELEVSVMVSSTVGGSGGVHIQVVELGGNIQNMNEKTHRIKIKMTPLLTKEEIRENLKQNNRLWENVMSTAMKATSKEDGMVGED
jgi:hypothetical protein